MLTDDRSLSMMPHIYQEFVEKKFEYRVTVFGNYYAATRIDSQSLEGASYADWRVSFDYLEGLRPALLAQNVIDACKKMLDKLGLRFGTFDLIEALDGEFYFLEVNQAGQWLWQEAHCPESKLLEPFAQYLSQATADFSFDATSSDSAFSAQRVLDQIFEIDDYKEFLESADEPSPALSTDERE